MLSLHTLITLLQKRYWFSNAVLIVLSVLFTNGLLDYLYYQRILDKQKIELAEINYNILGLLGLNQGKLEVLPDTEVKDQAKAILERYDLDSWNPYQFAYVIDTVKQTIIWQPMYADDKGDNGFNQPLLFSLPDLNIANEFTYTPQFYQLRPNNAQVLLQQDSDYKAYYPYNYLVSAQDIYQEPQGTYKLIIGRSLASFQADFHQFWTKALLASSLLMLLLFLGYYYLSLWLIKPLELLKSISPTSPPKS